MRASDVMWPMCVCWVISRYCSTAPAATMPLCRWSTPKPLSVFTPKWRMSFCSAVCSVNTQSSSSKVKYFDPNHRSKVSLLPRSYSTSFGEKLTSSFSTSSIEPSPVRNSPVDMSRKATPQAALPKLTAARKLFSL